MSQRLSNEAAGLGFPLPSSLGGRGITYNELHE